VWPDAGASDHTMPRPLSLLTTVAVAAATASNCGSQWAVQSFAVDPPATVGAGQNVTMTATFEVPDGTPPITEGEISVRGVVSVLFDMETTYPMCKYLPCPLTAGTYSWSWVSPFPEGPIGRVQITLRIGGSWRPWKASWLCLRWTAYATGRASNETNAAVTWLYS
jgi:hypothetical protein